MEPVNLTFTRKEEHERTWRYEDPIVGELYIEKAKLGADPPEHIKVIIEEVDDN